MSHPRRGNLTAIRLLVLVALLGLAPSLAPQGVVHAQTPGLVATPSSAVPGASVDVQGTVFPAATSELPLLLPGDVSLATFVTDDAGAFVLAVMVPEVAPGTYALVAVVGKGELAVQAEVPLTIEAPPIIPTPTPEPTATPTFEPAATSIPTATPLPTVANTPTSVPTATTTLEPITTSTPIPTDTPEPRATMPPTPTLATAQPSSQSPDSAPAARLAAAAAAGPLTFTAVADSHVEQANPTTNFGTASTLLIDNNPMCHTYLRFDVSGLSGSVQSATLRLWVTDPATNGPPVYISSDTIWSETGITWTTKPAVTTPTDDKEAVLAGTWLEYNVTSLVGGNGSYTFALIPQSSNGLDVSSREGTATNRPQLVVSTSGAGTAAQVPASGAIHAVTAATFDDPRNAKGNNHRSEALWRSFPNVTRRKN